MIELHLSQQEIYFDQVSDSSNPQYNIGTYLVVNGNLNVELFKQSVISSGSVFDVFRFKSFSSNAPAASIQETSSTIQITELDLTTKDWSEYLIKQMLQERINRPFNIHTEYLYDFLLIKIKEGEYWFYTGFHHLFSDGYGVPYVFLSYVFDKYHALRIGEEKEFYYPAYLHLIEKSNDYLYSNNYELDKKYWKNRFSASQEPILQRKLNPVSFRTDSAQIFFSIEEQKKLRLFCLKHEISLQDYLVAILTVYYKKADCVDYFDFCLPIHNRGDRKERKTLGTFSKLIPCRIELDKPKLNELFKIIKINQRQDYRHKQFPVSHFNNLLKANVNNASQPFDICLNYRYFKLDTRETELALKGFRNDSTFSKTPIEYSWCDFAEKGNENLFLEITFREDYFTKTEIELFGKRILLIIDQFYNSINVDINTINIIPESEIKQLLFTFNDTDVAYLKDKTIVDLFEEQVLKTPNNIAVVFEEKELTYGELNERSNQLADYLQKRYAIQPDNLVGIKQERSEWMIISILGVLKSGGAYVPIDPEYPQDRIEYIEKDTNCKVCIDENELGKFRKSQENYSKNQPISFTKVNNLAYVIYTSGSTGKPKGVMIEHGNAYSFIKWSHDEFKNSDFDTVFFTTSLNFDLSVFEIFHTLTKGKELKVLKDGLSIPKNLDKEKKQMINTVPSVVGSLLQQGMSFESISVLNMAGEPIPANYKTELKGKVKEIRNLYGPSEDTTYSTIFRIDKDQRDLIGHPISNTQIYILNEATELQPIGVVGEICIGGEGLARGYLNQAELTKEKFIRSPFKEGARLYKTGDLGRWLPDGNIEFFGRKDDQVKIRGYRIELGEIEHTLLTHVEIEAAVVLAKENERGEKDLIAYIVSNTEQNTNALRSYLKDILPDYMLPSYYVQLEVLPLNTNGKIDKKGLPDPEGLGLVTGVEYVAPRNEIEEKLVKIWQEVLQRENIGVKEDFFSLGGHSLKAVRLSNEYQKELSVKISLKELFTHTSIETHSELIQFSQRSEFIQIEKVGQQANYPISDAQRRLWVLSQFEDGSVAYNIPGSINLNQDIDIDCFKRAIDSVIARHEILHTVFKEDETGEIKQWVLGKEDLGFSIDYKDYRKEENKQDKVKDYITEDSYKAFDLEKGPLLRSGLLQLEDQEYVFYYNMHHIISDGWSMDVLSKDVFSYYDAYKENKEPELEELRIQYKDYSAWQLAQIDEESFKVHRDYWLVSLSGELPLLDLPSSKQRPRIKTHHGHGLSTYIDQATTGKLKRYSQENGGSLFMGLLAAWNVLIYRYTSQKDIIIGSPVAGREHADLEDQIGFYINTLGLRNEIKPEESFEKLYSRVKETTLNAYSHQMYPFDRLVEELELQRDTSRSAVFDVMLVLQNNGEKTKGVELKEEELNQIVDHGYSASKFDLEISVQEIGDYLSLHIVYNPDVYEREMIESLIKHYGRLLNALLKNPEEKVSQIDYLSEEIKQLLFTFNDTDVAYLKDKTIVDLFEEQVLKTPNNIAVVFEEKELTYGELNERSNQLADYLQKRYAIQPDNLVGIKQERSEWMIISILGVLKSGGAYVPIDPEYPQDRIEYIEKDTNCKVCIDENELGKFRKSQENYSKNQPISFTKVNNLAYVIYTSGSTGKPKGVMIEHGNAYSFIKWSHDEFKNSDFDTVFFTTSLNFDLSVFEIFHTLTKGKELKVLKDGLSIPKNLDKEKKQMINTVPSVVGSLLQQGMSFESISVLNMAGEPIPANYKTELKGKVKEIRNLYGPSEDTTYSTIFRIDKDQRDLIGHPISNTQIYILNEATELQPIGVVGEICIGGEGLARGYLNQAELTKEKFIRSPFKEGARLYKTGDLGRWLPDGNIEFFGRKDDQVKIRGYRIELGEIEHTLLTHVEIEAAVVLAKENERGEKDLIAYIVSNTEQNTNALRSYLKDILPDYMLPSYYVQLEVLPLNTNGKIDKKGLPDPEGLGLVTGVEYVAPRNEIEEKLVKIWQEVLQRENIGVKEDFFSLGGHSLKAVRLSNEYQKELSVKISLKELFTHTSIETHSELIQFSQRSEFIQIEKVGQQANYPISDAQRRLWVLSQFEDGSVAYNIPGSINLNQDIDIDCFKRAIDSVIARHEILHTVFKEDETGEIKQWVLGKEDLGFSIDYKDYRKEENKQDKVKDYITEDSYKAFDLEKGPLLRSGLLQLEDQEYVFYYNMHHIISDGWSMDVLSKDVFSYYDAYKENKEPELEELRIQYKDYSAWQLAQIDEESFKVHRDYWLVSLSGELPLLDLPSSKQRPRIKTHHGHGLSTYIDQATTGKLKRYSQENGGSLFMGLLAAWNVLIYRYTSQKDIIIGSPVAGREHADLEDQIGFYINTLGLRNEIKPEESFEKLYSRVKETTLNAYSHQMYPFDRLVEELELQRDTSRSAVFDVMLVLQNNGEKTKGVELKEEELNQIVDHGYCTPKFDIGITLQEVGDYLSLQVEYNPDVYEREMVEGLMSHYRQLLDAILANPEEKISQIDYLSEEEKHELLVRFNDTDVAYPKDKTIVDLFEEQVLKTPNDIAVVFEEKEITYRELDEKSNQLAYYLRENYEINPDDLVGIKLDRSEWMIISILGVLKSGGAYVPIDPEYPQDRIDYMEKDTNCKVCIDEDELVKFKESQESYSKKKPRSFTKADNLAYVIYTSGSTGNPKGVMIKHGSILNKLFEERFVFGLNNKIITYCLTNYVFDVSLLEIVFPLIFGGKIVMPTKEGSNDIKAIVDRIEQYKVNILQGTPTYFSYFLMELNDKQITGLNNVLETICIGGESLSETLVSRMKISLPDVKINNHYGPTEITIDAIVNEDLNSFESNILGKPLGNTKIYILDDYENVVPVNIKGEIVISGPSVSHGYLNQEESTKKKFIDSPFKEGERLYKTGDFGRWLNTGKIEFFGRKDDQVKIRGYRIELGEIEVALRKHPKIKNAVVLIRNISEDFADQASSEIIKNNNNINLFIEENKTKNVLKFIKALNNVQFDISLHIINNEFIDTPQENQRNWIINRFHSEIEDDLIYLDKVIDRFVSGSKREFITDEWSKSQAVYSEEELIIDNQQVMQSWERPLMEKMAEIATESHGDILEIGFGMGISATCMIEKGLKSYTVVECNEEVILFFNEWKKQYPAVSINIIKGKWQDISEQLGLYDAIFFDTYPLDEDEFVEFVINNITFAEHFFPTAYDHLKPGGVFTYYTNEIDTFSRRHQRLVLNYFESFTLSVVSNLSPPADCNYWWADSMVAIKAVKSIDNIGKEKITSKRQTSCDNTDFTLDVNVKFDGFINPSSNNQRNWTIQRFLEENKEDFIYINIVTNRFVSGSKREFITDEWSKSQAVYSEEELIIDNQQVMQSWERPLMEKMAEIATESHGDILEIGFGMGISATCMIEKGLKSYTVVECNEEVILFFNKWKKQYPAVSINIIKGKWQDISEQLGLYDAIFFDTYPLDEDEFVEHVINNITFAEHFFPTAYDHLKPEGVFTYYTNEIDTFSRRHQRLVLNYFESFTLSVVSNLSPPADCNYWWADSMVAVKAVKSGREIQKPKMNEVFDLNRRIEKLRDDDKKKLASQLGYQYFSKINNTEIVAYIASNEKQNILELRSYLKEILPDYMLPAYYIQMEELPMTPNGKIDRRSLPDPQGLELKNFVEFIAPRNEIEEKLLMIWKKILQRDNIGVKDDFFAVGGHSLKAIRLSNEYQKDLAVKISLKDLFVYTSIESHALLIESSKKSKFIQIEKVDQQSSYPISDAQRRLWVLSQFESGSVAYNMPGSINLKGKYELVLFQKAFDTLILRHEILRTVFKEDEIGEIRQWILKSEDLGFKIEYKDFRNIQAKEQKVKDYINVDSYKTFDLEKGPLLRANLLHLEEDSYVFYFNIHHIISDGWSMDVLSKEVLSYYDAYKENKLPLLKELRIQYKDYSAWQLGQLEEASFNLHRDYWLNNLNGELSLLDLPSSHQRPKIKTYNGRTLCTYFNKDLSQKLKEYSHQHGGTLFMGLLASLNVLLYRYTGQNNLIIGSPIAGREHADLENQIGFYVNTLALRNEIKSLDNFDELFLRVKQNTLDAYSHQMYPFDRLVEELNLQRDISRSAVFDIMLVLQNIGEKVERIELKEEEASQIFDQGSKTSKFDLLISVQEQGDHLSFSVEYNTDVYERAMIEGVITHYKTIISKLVSDPTQTLGKIDYLSKEEKQKLLITLNDTKVDYDKKTVIELFEEQVVKTPDKIALVFGEYTLTYSELNERSNNLAHILKEKYQVSKTTKVGVMLIRSLESVISMLGVMKTGACYVPIDHDYPTERVSYILNDSGLHVIVSTESLWKKHVIKEGVLIDIKMLNLEARKNNNPAKTNQLDDGAYVIYTSGSTGNPKGVLQTHRMMSNLIQWDIYHSGIDRNLKHLQYTSFSFDVSLQDCWSALSAGGTIYIADEKIRIDFLSLWMNIINNEIQVLSFPFSAFQQFIIQNADQDLKDLQIKHIVCSGEQLIVNSLLHKFLDNNPKIVLHNHYGPSETHVVTSYKMSSELCNIESRSPIGMPISNNRIYILDEHQNLVPQGILGELYIGGENLAAGYLNLVDETEEKFIDCIFEPGKLYKTGDQGYRRSDGNIEFIGRKDDQIKIRGFRIELGEVEHALLQHDQIEEVAVLVNGNEDDEKELVAYIVSKSEQNSSELRSYLKAILPDYMLPSHYIQMQEFLLTPNGKIDKKSLLNSRGLKLKSAIEYVAPRNKIEDKIIEILAGLLGKPKNLIGINDNFFDLGINSIKLIKLLGLINKEFSKNLKVILLFEHSTVNELSLYIFNESIDKTNDAEVLNEDNISSAMDEMIDLM